MLSDGGCGHFGEKRKGRGLRGKHSRSQQDSKQARASFRSPFLKKSGLKASAWKEMEAGQASMENLLFASVKAAL